MPSVVPRRKAGAMIRVMFSAALAAAALLLATPARAVAQVPVSGAQQDARVNEPAPVFLLPDETRTPLRTLPRGTSATVERVQGEWVQITFNDPQLGRRTGWIQRKYVTLSAAASPPSPPTVAPQAGNRLLRLRRDKPTAAAAAAARQAVSSRIRHVRLRQNVRVRQASVPSPDPIRRIRSVAACRASTCGRVSSRKCPSSTPKKTVSACSSSTTRSSRLAFRWRSP